VSFFFLPQRKSSAAADDKLCPHFLLLPHCSCLLCLRKFNSSKSQSDIIMYTAVHCFAAPRSHPIFSLCGSVVAAPVGGGLDGSRVPTSSCISNPPLPGRRDHHQSKSPQRPQRSERSFATLIQSLLRTLFLLSDLSRSFFPPSLQKKFLAGSSGEAGDTRNGLLCGCTGEKSGTERWCEVLPMNVF